MNWRSIARIERWKRRVVAYGFLQEGAYSGRKCPGLGPNMSASQYVAGRIVHSKVKTRGVVELIGHFSLWEVNPRIWTDLLVRKMFS